MRDDTPNHPTTRGPANAGGGRGIAGGSDLRRFVAEGHFGLAGMRERAAMIGGHLEVQSALDYGTVVILEVPY